MADNSENEDLKRRLNDLERENQAEIKRLKFEFKQELDFKDQQLEQKDRQLDFKDQQLEQKDRQLELKDHANEKLRLNSTIEGLWANHNTTNFEIESVTTSKYHVDRKRLPATAVQAAFSLVTATLQPNTLAKPSKLLAAFNRAVGESRSVHTVENEADVQGYVHDALTDAITIMNGLIGPQGNKALLIARRESNIFSNKPDHVVVCLGSSKTPIFVVETKLPMGDFDKINLKVWGQVFDYHAIMRVAGHNNPFVVLSTFEKSCITWVEHNKKCETIAIATDHDVRYTQSLERLKKHFSSEVKNHVTLELPEGTPSPCQLKEVPLVQYVVNARRRKDDGTKRKLSRSRTFESKDLVNLFVNAIACSLRDFHGSSSISRNEGGYELTNKHVLTLTTNEYFFETISLKVLPGKFKSNRFSSQANNGFHIFDFLGSGRTSKTFLAATTKGHECVLKMYVRKFDEGNNYQPIPQRQIESDTRKSTQAEQRMYKLIYGMDIPKIILFKHTCLVLPYFRPVRTDERADAVIALKVLLKEKFRVEQGRATKYYKFRDDDQIWRHCGYTGKNEEKALFVFDLADLEECRTEEAHKDYIDKYIGKLSGSVGNSTASALSQSA